MFKLKQIGKTHSDETTDFKVVLDKPYTVSSFIDMVLKDTSEWGYIGIKKQNSFFFGDPYCEYRYGKLLSAIPKEYLNREIKDVTSNGGWTRMDYILTLK